VGKKGGKGPLEVYATGAVEVKDPRGERRRGEPTRMPKLLRSRERHPRFVIKMCANSRVGKIILDIRRSKRKRRGITLREEDTSR